MTSNNFFSKVYEVVIQIPEGRVTSYGAIANYLVSPQSARMVGWALNKVNTAEIPAHRVVNKQGLLTGKFHFDGVTLMQQLLENEGIEVLDNQIQDLKKVFWDPSKELS
jgi:methylated-DNA-protein-cysteine methyltransferase-like protein